MFEVISRIIPTQVGMNRRERNNDDSLYDYTHAGGDESERKK